MRRQSLYTFLFLVGLFVVLLVSACTASPTAAPAVVPTSGGTDASAAQPTNTVAAATVTPTPPALAPTETTAATSNHAPAPSDTTRPLIQTGRTRPPDIPGLTPAPLNGGPEGMTSRMEELLSGFVRSVHPNLVIRVEVDGQPLADKAWGYADTETKVPLSVTSRFRIGSISKSMTAMGILMLQEEGKLDVQDPVCKYVPDCPASWQPVTIHHLLTHTSGIPDYRSLANYANWKMTPLSIAQVVDRFRDAPLGQSPGTDYMYSNSGYVLASYIIELVSGMPFEGYLKKAVFEPLDMANTGLSDPGVNMAVGRRGSIRSEELEAVTNHYGAGGLYSTSADLAIWAKVFMDDTALPARARNLALADHVVFAAAHGLEWYGYGIGAGVRHGRFAFGHAGAVDGFKSDWNVYPDIRGTIISLTNDDRVDLSDLWLGLEEQIFAK